LKRRSTRSGDAQNKATTTTTRGGESEAENFGCLFAARNNSTDNSNGSRQRKKRPCVFPPHPHPLSWIYEHLIEFRFIFICRGLGSFRKLAIRRIKRANGKKAINGYVWEEVGRSRSSM
jgi:hypothetical protein